MKLNSSQTKLSMNTTQQLRGFTLLEIVTSLTIMSVLVVAMGSALTVASRGMPDPNSPVSENISTSRIIDQIAGELQYAFAVKNASTTGIEFIVERHGAPVTIKYVWSGFEGDPLIREYDGGTPVRILPSVAEFNLSYDLGPASVYITGSAEGTEIELAKHAPMVYSGNDFPLRKKNWLGQYFKPILPADAESWRVTRVVFRAKEHGTEDQVGLTLVQMRTADIDKVPTSTIIEQHVMNETDLNSSYSWRRFLFSNVAFISPDDGLCLVLQWAQGKAADIEYVSDPSGFANTSDAGDSWNFNSDKSLYYYVYGKVTMPGFNAYPICSIKIGLNVYVENSSRLQTTALLLNQPTAQIIP